MMQRVLSPGARWLERRDLHRLQLLARIKPEASADEARAELQLLQSQLTEQVETHWRWRSNDCPGSQACRILRRDRRRAFRSARRADHGDRAARPRRCLCEPREHAAGTGRRETQGNGNAAGAWRKPRADRPSAADREPDPRWTRRNHRVDVIAVGQPAALGRRWKHRPGHVWQRSAVCGLARTGRTNPRVHGCAVGRDGTVVWPFARARGLEVGSDRRAEAGIVRPR